MMNIVFNAKLFRRCSIDFICWMTRYGWESCPR